MVTFEVITKALQTPLTDSREYSVIRLPNHLEVLIVHDPDTPDVGASMDVEVGSMSDEIPGTAHALEHMVLRGSAKYPEERDFSNFVSTHSGSKNAATHGTHTNYFFQITVQTPPEGQRPPSSESSPLLMGLDRLAHLAIDPLITEETVDRELHAVDSEYKWRLEDDGKRLWQFEYSTSNPKHPWNRFSVGNLEVYQEETASRGLGMHEVLRQFHHKHYSANRIKLCVVGRENVDVLTQWVLDTFSDVPNKELRQETWPDELPHTRDNLAIQYFVKPVKTYRELVLKFPFFDETAMHDTLPSEYLNYLLQHKGPGSFFAYAKDKGWATAIQAGAILISPGSPAIYCCRIYLTLDGANAYKEVLRTFFVYMGLLRASGPQVRLFDEHLSISQLAFRYKEKSTVANFAPLISARMQMPLPRDWLLGPSLLRKFDREVITQGLEYLTPQNLRMVLVSPEGVWDKKEKWYGIEYREEKIAEDFMGELLEWLHNSAEHLPAGLHLPRPNPFLAKNLSLRPTDPTTSENPRIPMLIRNDRRARTWWTGDALGVPKAHVAAICRSPLVDGSAEAHAKLNLLVRLVNDALMPKAYEAEQASLTYRVSWDSRGLLLSASGFNDKLADLLHLVVTSIRELQIRDDRFQIIKRETADAYRNADVRIPYRHAVISMWWLTTESFIPPEKQAASLADIDAEVIRLFKDEFLSQLHIETYVHGNMGSEEALQLTALLESTLGREVLPVTVWPAQRSLALPPRAYYHYEQTIPNPKEVNNGLVYWIHIGDVGDAALRGRARLLGQLIGPVAFDWLRTKLQLGYIIWAGHWPTYTAQGLGVYLQGEQPCGYMERCVAAFLETYTRWLAAMPTSEFETHKRSLVTKILQRPKNQFEAYKRFWDQIEEERYNFDEAQQDAEHIGNLTQADMAEFYNDYVAPSSARGAKIVVAMKSHVNGSREPPEHVVPKPSTDEQSDEARLREHLRTKLQVSDAEMDDAIELWHEVVKGEKSLRDTERKVVIDVGGEAAFKAKLARIDASRQCPLPSDAAENHT